MDLAEIKSILISGDNDEEKNSVLSQIEDLDDDEKDFLRQTFLNSLETVLLPYQRGWIISALGYLPDTVDIIKKYIDIDNEPDEFVRFWSLIALSKKIYGKELKTILIQAAGDRSRIVKALSYRLLIETGFDRERIHQLEEMVDPSRLDDCFAACKSLRGQASTGGQIPFDYKERLVRKLQNCVWSNSLSFNIKRQALLTMGDLIEQPESHYKWINQSFEHFNDDQIILLLLYLLEKLHVSGCENNLLSLILFGNSTISERATDVLKSIIGQEALYHSSLRRH